MFGNNSKKETNTITSSTPTTSAIGGGINSLAAGTKVVGDLVAQNDIRVDGDLDGNLKCMGKLIVGPKGNINGTINCQSALVEGRIDGTLVVKELLHIKETAVISGEVSSGKLTVQTGAVFNVKCAMSGQVPTAPPITKPIDKKVATG